MTHMAFVALLALVLAVLGAQAQSTLGLYESAVNLTYSTDGTYLYGTVTHNYQAWVAIGWHAPGVFPSQGAMWVSTHLS